MLEATQKKLTTDLASLVNGYLSARKGRSRQTLARECGIAYNTITRIVQRETVPNFESAFAILKVVADRQQLLEFIKHYYPNIYTGMAHGQNSVPVESIVDLNLASVELDQIFSDTLGFEIFCLASRPDGVPLEFIRDEFGRTGLKKIAELIRMGALQKISETECVKLSASYIYEYKSLSRAVKKTIDILDGNRETCPNNILWYSTNVNDQGLKKLNEAWHRYHDEVKEIYAHPDNLGSTNVIIAAAMGFLGAFRKPRESH